MSGWRQNLHQKIRGSENPLFSQFLQIAKHDQVRLHDCLVVHVQLNIRRGKKNLAGSTMLVNAPAECNM